MITEARLKWLNDNKQRGDIPLVVKNLADTGVTKPEAYVIIKGVLWGEHGEAVTDELERVIKERQRKLKKEEKKFSQLC